MVWLMELVNIQEVQRRVLGFMFSCVATFSSMINDSGQLPQRSHPLVHQLKDDQAQSH